MKYLSKSTNSTIESSQSTQRSNYSVQLQQNNKIPIKQRVRQSYKEKLLQRHTTNMPSHMKYTWTTSNNQELSKLITPHNNRYKPYKRFSTMYKVKLMLLEGKHLKDINESIKVLKSVDKT